MGDIPIFVAHDSAEVWANPHLFLLDQRTLSAQGHELGFATHVLAPVLMTRRLKPLLSSTSTMPHWPFSRSRYARP